MSEYLIPATVIVVGNLFSGPPGSRSWEIVTAVFGWATIVCVILSMAAYALGADRLLEAILLPAAAFSLIQALSRDYERILQPVKNWIAARWGP